MHAHIHTYTHKCTAICVHAHVHACTSTRMHTCMHKHMHVQAYARMAKHMHRCMHACPHAGMHTCIHACIHTCLHACTPACMHTCMRTHMCACTHACAGTETDAYTQCMCLHAYIRRSSSLQACRSTGRMCAEQPASGCARGFPSAQPHQRHPCPRRFPDFDAELSQMTRPPINQTGILD